MTEAQAVEAIRGFFKTGWGSKSPLCFEDQDYTPPADFSTWARLTVRHNTGDQLTMGAPGSNRHEQQGRATVQIFAKQGQFALDALSKASDAAAIFRGKSTSDIHFFETTVRPIGPDGYGWFQVNVETRFRHSLYA